MDSAACLLLVIRQITQLLSTRGSVITLGQLSNVPLMWSPSELTYRFEPHDYIYSAVPVRAAVLLHLPGTASAGEVYPGYGWVGTWEGYTGYPADPYLGLSEIY